MIRWRLNARCELWVYNVDEGHTLVYQHTWKDFVVSIAIYPVPGDLRCATVVVVNRAHISFDIWLFYAKITADSHVHLAPFLWQEILLLQSNLLLLYIIICQLHTCCLTPISLQFLRTFSLLDIFLTNLVLNLHVASFLITLWLLYHLNREVKELAWPHIVDLFISLPVSQVVLLCISLLKRTFRQLKRPER